MEWRKYGDTDTNPMCDEDDWWWKGSAAGGIRFMTSQWANEPKAMPRGGFTLDSVNHPNSQCWLRYMGLGIPIEVQVDVCNRLGKDLWTVIPRPASSELVQFWGEYVRDHLNPDLVVRFEVSNEQWNTKFPQYAGYRSDGWKLGLGKPDAVYGADNTANCYPAVSGDTEWAGDTGRTSLVWLHNQAYAKDTIVQDNGYTLGADGNIYTPGNLTSSVGGTYKPSPNSGGNQYIAKNTIPATLTVPPALDSTNWALWQNEIVARQRAYAEHVEEVYDQMESIFGSPDFGTRCLVVMGMWHSGIEQCVEQLRWGNMFRKTHECASAPYFAFGAGQYDEQTDPNVSPGPDRINQWCDMASDDIDPTIEKDRQNALRVLQVVTEAGGTTAEVPGWSSYEGGFHTFIGNWPGMYDNSNPEALQVYNDAIAYFETAERVRDIYRDYYVRQSATVPGVRCHFMAIQGISAFLGGSTGGTYQHFGASRDITKTDAPRYLGLRDASVELGGTYELPQAHARRRRRVVFLG